MTNMISTDTLTAIREALDDLGETGAHRVWRGDLQTRTEENASWLFVCAWPEQVDALRTEAGAHGDLHMVQLCDEAAHDANALRGVLDALEDARAQTEGDYTISSVKVTETFAGTLAAAIQRARDIDAEYDPAFGVQVTLDGETLWDSEAE